MATAEPGGQPPAVAGAGPAEHAAALLARPSPVPPGLVPALQAIADGSEPDAHSDAVELILLLAEAAVEAADR